MSLTFQSRKKLPLRGCLLHFLFNGEFVSIDVGKLDSFLPKGLLSIKNGTQINYNYKWISFKIFQEFIKCMNGEKIAFDAENAVEIYFLSDLFRAKDISDVCQRWFLNIFKNPMAFIKKKKFKNLPKDMIIKLLTIRGEKNITQQKKLLGIAIAWISENDTTECEIYRILNLIDYTGWSIDYINDKIEPCPFISKAYYAKIINKSRGINTSW